MERVHYRRHMPSRLHSPKQHLQPVIEYETTVNSKPKQSDTQESGGFREKFIVQGIISGIILAVILVFSMVDDPQVVNIRANLSQALSDHITAQQVAVEVNRLLGNPRQGSFIITPAYMDRNQSQDMYYPYLDPEALVPVTETPAVLTEGQMTAPRIDEDMLREILGYREGDDLQTTAPEPIILPEL